VPPSAPLDDSALPIYTIIAPLRGEERMAATLVRKLDALDYPGIMAHPPQAKPQIRPDI
jgi:cellulose synthase/poly-beta-1,6-N-acetylglucosamine synthase-like glycosyltransferase